LHGGREGGAERAQGPRKQVVKYRGEKGGKEKKKI